MAKSAKQVAYNDDLVRQICNDKNYKIQKDGTILTLVEKTGKVSIKNNWRFLSITTTELNYKYVKYKTKQLCLHRVLYQKFLGNLNDFFTINHKDGNPANNDLTNLELVSQAENNLHSYRVLNRKVNYGASKINLDIAREIRNLHQDGKKFKDLCELFKLSKGTISYIVNNKTWTKHV